MKLFKMDALHYALLAVLVLLVLYCATGVLREAAEGKLRWRAPERVRYIK